jgi:protein ImuA
MPETKIDVITRLQKQILQWQGFNPLPIDKNKGIGLGELESAFPNGVFPTGSIHEMICPTHEHGAATSGLLAGILQSLMQKGGVCLWISLSRKLFPPSLTVFEIQPDQIIFIDLQHEKDVLWTMEQALKCEGLAAVVAEVKEINMVQSRRLQLAVESSKVTGFILRNDPRKLSANTCVARWQVTHLPSELNDNLPGVGFPQWQIDLLRVRNGTPGSWKLKWMDGNFHSIEENMEIKIVERKLVG